MNDVDDRLRQLFEDKAREVPPHVEVPSGLRARSRRRIALNSVLALAIALMFAVGALGAMRVIRSAERITPGASGTRRGASEGAATSAPACSAGRLRADAALGGAMGSREGVILVTNVSSTTCTLQGRPTLTLLDADLRPITSGVEFVHTAPAWRVERRPKPAGWPVVTLRPGQAASVRVRWSNWCPQGRPAPLWRIGIPGGGREDVYGIDGVEPPPCNGRAAPSTIEIGPFEPPAP